MQTETSTRTTEISANEVSASNPNAPGGGGGDDDDSGGIGLGAIIGIIVGVLVVGGIAIGAMMMCRSPTRAPRQSTANDSGLQGASKADGSFGTQNPMPVGFASKSAEAV